MSIDQKKQLLIPFGSPRQPNALVRLVVAAVRPPILALGFVIGNLYKLCFGWLDRRAARNNEDRFAAEIRTDLSFLFAEYAAEIVPNLGTPFPPGFDAAYVTVAVGTVRLLFIRGRGDFSVSIASEFAPKHWEDLRLVVDRFSDWDPSQPRPSWYALEDVELRQKGIIPKFY